MYSYVLKLIPAADYSEEWQTSMLSILSLLE